VGLSPHSVSRRGAVTWPHADLGQPSSGNSCLKPMLPNSCFSRVGPWVSRVVRRVAGKGECYLSLPCLNVDCFNQYIYKPPYATNVGARFIVHFLHYMFRPLLVAIFRRFVIQKNSKSVAFMSTDPLLQYVQRQMPFFVLQTT
jgi:hypothetical protein